MTATSSPVEQPAAEEPSQEIDEHVRSDGEANNGPMNIKTPEHREVQQSSIHHPSPVDDAKNTVLISRGSPSDKPLPSLPFLTMNHGPSPSMVRRSLIDASEKPLRAHSQSASSKHSHGDKWPTLSPVKPYQTDFSKDDSKEDECSPSLVMEKSPGIHHSTEKPQQEQSSGEKINEKHMLHSEPDEELLGTTPHLSLGNIRNIVQQTQKDSHSHAHPHAHGEAGPNSRNPQTSWLASPTGSPDVARRRARPMPKPSLAANGYSIVRGASSSRRHQPASRNKLNEKTETKEISRHGTIHASPIRKHRAVVDKRGSPHRRSIMAPKGTSPPKFASILDFLESGASETRNRKSSIPIPTRLVQSSPAPLPAGGSPFDDQGSHDQGKTGSLQISASAGKSTSGIAKASKFVLKRLSSQSLIDGPVLRISESAERILLGDSPDKDTNLEMKHMIKKRPSLPDLGRSKGMLKEAGKAFGSVTSIGLPRSLTSRSLNLYDGDSSSLHSFSESLQSLRTATKTGRTDGESATRRSLPRADSGWPLRRRRTGNKVEVDDESSWDSPVPMRAPSRLISNAISKALSPVAESPFRPAKSQVTGIEVREAGPSVSAKNSLVTRTDDLDNPFRQFSDHFTKQEAQQLRVSEVDKLAAKGARPVFPKRSSSLTPPDSTRVAQRIHSSGTRADIERLVEQDLGDTPSDEGGRSSTVINQSVANLPKKAGSSFRGWFHKRPHTVESPHLSASLESASIGSGPNVSKGKGPLSNYSHSLPLRRRSRQGLAALSPATRYVELPEPGERSEDHGSKAGVVEEAMPLSGTSTGQDRHEEQSYGEDVSIQSEEQILIRLATRIANQARVEASQEKKDQYYDLFKVMIRSIGQFRDAEKAAAEARAAASRAELYSIASKRDLMLMAGLVHQIIGIDRPETQSAPSGTE